MELIYIYLAIFVGIIIGNVFPFRRKTNTDTREAYEEAIKQASDTAVQMYIHKYLEEFWNCTQSSEKGVFRLKDIGGKKEIVIDLKGVKPGAGRVVTAVVQVGDKWTLSIQSDKK